MEIKNSSYQSQSYAQICKPSFKGLTSKLSKTAYEKNDVIKLYEQYKEKSHGKIGRLPAQWIYCIPFHKRPEIIKKIFKDFGVIFSDLRKNTNSKTAQIIAGKKITELFQKAKILKRGQSSNIKYIDSGKYGDIYKLSLKNEHYAVKVFHNIIEEDNILNELHGNFFEQPVAQFIKSKIPKRKNNWFKFYFGDLENGIMVSQFEQGDNKSPQKPFNIAKIGIYPNILEHCINNTINGRVIDIGGVEILEQAKNKTLRFIYKKAIKDPYAPQQILEETVKWKNSPIYKNRLESIYCILQILPEKNAKKCLDLLLPASDKELSLYMATNMHFVPLNLRKNIFQYLYQKNDLDIDRAMAENLDLLDSSISENSHYIKELKKLNCKEIDEIIQKFL